MNQEIERKFLVDKTLWDKLEKPKGKKIIQAYLLTDPGKIIRARVKAAKGYITIKGKQEGITRLEFEYEIPVGEAEKIISQFGENTIDKIRYEIQIEQHIWEVDVFSGENEGLVVAEIELKSEEECFTKPEWVLKDVSKEAKYFNSNLSIKPFKSW